MLWCGVLLCCCVVVVLRVAVYVICVGVGMCCCFGLSCVGVVEFA